MSTTLTNSSSQVVLASYGTGNPFSAGSGVTVVNTHAGESAIYGDASEAWTLSNAGTIGGAVGALSVDGDQGYTAGMGVQVTAPLTLTNSGKIFGGSGKQGNVSGGSGGDGISMGAGGTLTNTTGGTIRGGTGAYGTYGGGSGGDGVSIAIFGTVTNQVGASIVGGSAGEGEQFTGGSGGGGIVLTAGGSVTNAGTITGGTSAYGGGAVSNGVLFEGSADSTLANSGTISGGVDGFATDIRGKAVQFADGNDRLILHSGSVLVGGADGGSGSNTLELGGGAVGTIEGIGTTITNFQTIVVDAGAQWTATYPTLTKVSALTVNGSLTLPVETADPQQLSQAINGTGTLTLDGGVTTIVDGATLKVANLTLADSAALNVNENLAYAGKLTEAAGTRVTVRTGKMLAIDGTIAGAGAINIGVGSTLRIAGTAGAAESIAFGADTGKLILINPKRFRSKITHLAAGDKIDIANANFAFNKNETLTFFENAKKTEGTLTLKNGANVVALHLFGQHVAQGFHIAGDGHGGTMITYKPPAAHAMDHLASGGG